MGTSALSAALSLSLPVIMHEFMGVAEEIAVAAAMVIVFFINFLTIRIFVFRSTGGGSLNQFGKFAVSSIGFRLAEYLAFLAVFKILEINYVVSLFCVLAIGTVAKFFFHRTYVFTKEK